MRTFSPDTKQAAFGIFLSALAVVVYCFTMLAVAKADGPSQADYKALAAIKQNQTILAKTREAHDQFETAKAGNETLSAQLAADGWRVDWSKMVLVPSGAPFVQAP